MRDISQEKKILRLLESYSPNWCPLYEVLELGVAQYNARIKTLRDEGHHIENRVEYHGQQRHSWFRLVRPEEI